MINVKDKTCIHPGCKVLPIFNVEGQTKRLYCSLHKLEGMINVTTKKCEFGIMIDGAGIGSAMMANKIPGVLAACANEIYTARNSRQHNGANLLTLGSMVVGVGVAKEIVKIFLTTRFEGDRNKKRVQSILDIEQRLLNNRG